MLFGEKNERKEPEFAKKISSRAVALSITLERVLLPVKLVKVQRERGGSPLNEFPMVPLWTQNGTRAGKTTQ